MEAAILYGAIASFLILVVLALVPRHRPRALRALAWGIGLGALAGVVGAVVPALLSPEANQAFLSGLVVAPPVFIVSAWVAYALSRGAGRTNPVA